MRIMAAHADILSPLMRCSALSKLLDLANSTSRPVIPGLDIKSADSQKWNRQGDSTSAGVPARLRRNLLRDDN